MAERIRILIGDDHRIVREGLKQVLADAPDMCVTAEGLDGPQVLEQVDALGGAEGLDLVLLDIAMPGIDGRGRSEPGCRRAVVRGAAR